MSEASLGKRFLEPIFEPLWLQLYKYFAKGIFLSFIRGNNYIITLQGLDPEAANKLDVKPCLDLDAVLPLSSYNFPQG